jgi:hypothetical protein
VLPKLFGPLAARYQDKADEFTQVVVSGYRDYNKKTQGPTQHADQAEMAFLEFSHQPRAVSFQMAQGMLDSYRGKLKEVQEQLYNIEKVTLTDPVSLNEYEHSELSEKMLSMNELKRLRKREADFKRMVEMFEVTVNKGIENQDKHRAYLLGIMADKQKQLEANPTDKQLVESIKLLGFEISSENTLSVSLLEEVAAEEAVVEEKPVKKAESTTPVKEEEPKEMPKPKHPTFFRSRFESMKNNFKFR